MEIPKEHWTSDAPKDTWSYDPKPFIASWEKQLIAALKKEPDPEKRFDDWLKRKAAGETGMAGVRLIFLEQPYLGWAELVEKTIETEEKSLRKQIANEIQHPSDD